MQLHCFAGFYNMDKLMLNALSEIFTTSAKRLHLLQSVLIGNQFRVKCENARLTRNRFHNITLSE